MPSKQPVPFHTQMTYSPVWAHHSCWDFTMNIFHILLRLWQSRPGLLPPQPKPLTLHIGLATMQTSSLVQSCFSINQLTKTSSLCSDWRAISISCICWTSLGSNTTGWAKSAYSPHLLGDYTLLIISFGVDTYISQPT